MRRMRQGLCRARSVPTPAEILDAEIQGAVETAINRVLNS
jgi:hypothetical protein